MTTPVASPPETTPSPAGERGSIGRGIGLLALLHLLQIPLYPAIVPLVLIGVSQLIYLIPAVIVQKKKGRTETVKGLWIGAGLTVLVNATCFGLVLSSLARGGWH